MNIRNSRSRRRASLLASLVVVLSGALAAVAGGAQAAAWYAGTTETNGSILTSPEPLNLTLGQRTFGSENLRFFMDGRVGSGGTPVRIAATGVEVENKRQQTQIFNDQLQSARSYVTLVLTGVTMVTPGHCGVSSEVSTPGRITTKILTSSLTNVAGTNYLKFSGANGSSLFAFRLYNLGGTCPIAGLYSSQGVLAAEVPDVGSSAKSHEIVFSDAAEKAVGAEWTLPPGNAGNARMEGSLIGTLSSGKYWYAK